MQDFVKMMNARVKECEKEAEVPSVEERTISPPPKSWAEITRDNQRRQNRYLQWQPKTSQSQEEIDEDEQNIDFNKILKKVS